MQGIAVREPGWKQLGKLCQKFIQMAAHFLRVVPHVVVRLASHRNHDLFRSARKLRSYAGFFTIHPPGSLLSIHSPLLFLEQK